jgi:hypothetical protein
VIIGASTPMDGITSRVPLGSVPPEGTALIEPPRAEAAPATPSPAAAGEG